MDQFDPIFARLPRLRRLVGVVARPAVELAPASLLSSRRGLANQCGFPLVYISDRYELLGSGTVLSDN